MMRGGRGSLCEGRCFRVKAVLEVMEADASSRIRGDYFADVPAGRSGPAGELSIAIDGAREGSGVWRAEDEEPVWLHAGAAVACEHEILRKGEQGTGAN